MKTRFFVALLVLLAALVVVPPASADQSNKVKTVPVQQLSNRVEKLIKIVEGSTLPCETRNSVVRKLRLLDDALRSGRRSAAHAMVLAWRQHAWNLQAARVIYPELGSSLQNHLREMVDEIGYGWPDEPGPTRHWEPLPACESSTGVLGSASGHVVGSYNPTATDPSADVKIFIDMMLSLVPDVGGIMSGLVDLMWPQGPDSDANVFNAVAQAEYDAVKSDVNKIGKALMGDPKNPEAGSWNSELKAFYDWCDANGGRDSKPCVNLARETLWTQWNGVNGNTFLTYKADFLKKDDEAGAGVNYLPLYAQFENLYMTFLRDGVILHNKYWGDRTDLDPNWTAIDLNVPPDSMDDELMPANKSYGIGYINDVYNAGLPSGDWATRNAYIRNMTLNVLDYRDTWKYIDPRQYPNGVQGGVKLTRMIYSDPVGNQGTPPHPTNVPGPLKETTVWTTRVDEAPFVSHLWIDAVQATAPPLLGPAQSGAVTGDTTQPSNYAHYYNLAALGPIIEVEAQSIAQFYTNGTLMGYFPHWIAFDFATGARYTAGDSSSGLGACTFPLTSGCYTAIKYDGEVLATVQAVGASTSLSGSDGEAGSVVFGFRFADSFGQAGEAIGVDSGKCLNVTAWSDLSPAMIWPCDSPPAAPEIWTYDPSLQQISFTNPADNSKYCLNAAVGGTIAGTRVVISNPCDDGALLPLLSSGSQTSDTVGNPVVSSQRWTIDAVGNGSAKITNVKSGLVITPLDYSTADGTGLSLEGYAGDAAQQWQEHDPWIGEIHGVSSGRCVDVANSPGTQVHIYDCNGTATQQWTYNPTNKELIYAMAPSLCLEARGGGTSSGTAVQINTCTGAPEQQWTLQGLSYSVNQGGGGTITNVKSGLVMNVGATANNTLVELYKSNSTENQQWSRTSMQGGALHAVGAGKCLTMPEWASGTKPVIQTCASPLSAEQTWTYHPFAQTLTVTPATGPSGTMCLTGYGYSAYIEACNGTVYQRWSLDLGNQTVTNQYNGLVLDVAGGGTADGTGVLLYPLWDPVSTNQQWVWPLY